MISVSVVISESALQLPREEHVSWVLQTTQTVPLALSLHFSAADHAIFPLSYLLFLITSETSFGHQHIKQQFMSVMASTSRMSQHRYLRMADTPRVSSAVRACRGEWITDAITGFNKTRSVPLNTEEDLRVQLPNLSGARLERCILTLQRFIKDSFLIGPKGLKTYSLLRYIRERILSRLNLSIISCRNPAEFDQYFRRMWCTVVLLGTAPERSIRHYRDFLHFSH